MYYNRIGYGFINNRVSRLFQFDVHTTIVHKNRENKCIVGGEFSTMSVEAKVLTKRQEGFLMLIEKSELQASSVHKPYCIDNTYQIAPSNLVGT